MKAVLFVEEAETKIQPSNEREVVVFAMKN